MMITNEALHKAINTIESGAPELANLVVSAVAANPGIAQFIGGPDFKLLTNDERNYHHFLAMVLLLVAKGESFSEKAAGDLEEEMWGAINSKWTIAQEAEAVDDDDAWSVFLIDALAEDEQTEFLTREGTSFMWVKLQALREGFSGQGE